MEKQRYKPGEYPAYDAALAGFRSNSAVIGDSRSFWNEEAFGALGGVRKLHNFVVEYEATLERAMKQVEAVARAFEEHKLKCKRLGMREPKELPPDLLEPRLLAEARVDCIVMEIASLKELLARAEASEQKIMDDKVLMYGPWGSGVGEPVRQIDGQPVVIDEEGYPRIDCQKSPYHGMKVCDYRDYVRRPWIDKITAEQAAAWEKAKDTTLPMAERERWAELSQQYGGGKTLPWDRLPPPAGGVLRICLVGRGKAAGGRPPSGARVPPGAAQPRCVCREPLRPGRGQDPALAHKAVGAWPIFLMRALFFRRKGL